VGTSAPTGPPSRARTRATAAPYDDRAKVGPMTSDRSRADGTVPGALCLVLHSHLPWLQHHGVWPLGEEWLHQAWVESYVPLVAELDALAAEGHRDVLTLGVTPVLAAQLDDPRALDQARTWAALWQLRCRELGFTAGERTTRLARYEYATATAASQALESRWRSGGSPVLRSLADAGVVQLLGGPATHPFLPLLLPEVVDVALQVGLEDSRWRLGSEPAGIWSPECGYRPGLARHLAARGVTHFLVDEQTVTDSGGSPSAGWTVDGTDVVAVPRDLEVTNLIWSSRSGYPTAAAYRDFHAREPFTGAHLWAITGQDVPPSAKAPYDPEAAAAQVSRDVASFVTAVSDRLQRLQRERGLPGLVVAAYDTELFGHWWHEGPAFLGQAVRALRAAGVTVTTLERALADGHIEGPLELGPGSWGAGKDFSVWDGAQVSSIVADNAALQRRWLSVMSAERDGHRLGERRPDLDQLLRTLLNALSSDWAFMVTRDQAVDYAHRRAGGHRDDFHRLASLVEDGDAAGAREEAQRQARTDLTFPWLDARTTGTAAGAPQG
jgi:1,4-alpha-glucan branching enzyme